MSEFARAARGARDGHERISIFKSQAIRFWWLKSRADERSKHTRAPTHSVPLVRRQKRCETRDRGDDKKRPSAAALNLD